MKNKLKCHHGFTLLEILVAISVMGILFAAISGILFPLRNSIQVWNQKAEERDEKKSFLSQIEKDLQFPFISLQDRSLPFYGDQHTINFFTHERLRFVGEKSLPGGRRVEYRYLPSKQHLKRGERILLSHHKDPTYLIMKDRIKEIQFQFLGSHGWQSKWNERVWPEAIKVKGVFLTEKKRQVDFEKKFFPLQDFKLALKED